MNKFSHIVIFATFSFSISSDIINDSIEKNSQIFENVALEIWEFAELGYLENKSSALLADTLKANGFKISIDGHGADECLGGYANNILSLITTMYSPSLYLILSIVPVLDARLIDPKFMSIV